MPYKYIISKFKSAGFFWNCPIVFIIQQNQENGGVAQGQSGKHEALSSNPSTEKKKKKKGKDKSVNWNKLFYLPSFVN
jgi:hypothetical protein